VEIKHIARVCLAARRAAQEERELAVRNGVLRKVVIDNQRVAALSIKYSPIAAPANGARY
jgi:hypothetical protein